MYPQSELDNYKLQVELLQEKLQRSEENRNQLKNEFEQIVHKRNEHDKMVRKKSEKKYQEFLDEQKKRNERNKMLMQMLERIDQQTAALSARSERLKMMKLQYEMYFARLVQSQTMRCIQNTATIPAAATTIPILLPTPTPSSSHVLPSNPASNEQHVVLNPSTTQTPTAMAPYQYVATTTTQEPVYSLTPRSNNDMDTTISTPTPSFTPQQQQHQWTLAMATATPAGILLTNTSPAMPATMAAPQNFLNYMQFPMQPGYDMSSALQQLQLQQQQQQMQLQPRLSAIFNGTNDLLESKYFNNNNNSSSKDDKYAVDMPTLRTFDKMTNETIAAMLAKETPPTELATKYDNNKKFDMLTANKNNEPTAMIMPNSNNVEMLAAGTTATTASITPTSSVSLSLPYDILPKTKNFNTTTPAATTTTTADNTDKNYVNDDTTTSIVNANNQHQQPQPEILRRFNEFTHDNNNNKDMISDARAITTNKANDNKLEDDSSKKLLNVAAADAPNIDVINHRQKIDEAWQLPSLSSATSPTNAEQQQQQIAKSFHSLTIKEEREHIQNDGDGDAANINSNTKQNHLQLESHIDGSSLTKQEQWGKRAEEMPTGNDAMTANQYAHSQMTEMITPVASKVSIENIENAIYGELVNPPQADADTRHAAQELLGDLVTQAQGAEIAAGQVETGGAEAVAESILNDDYANYGGYDATAVVGDSVNNLLSSTNYNPEATASESSYEPTYAGMDGTTNAEVYQAAQADANAYDTTAVADAANINYDEQYAVDPNAAQQQDYGNMDYNNYDASQYGGDGTYDPSNMYPGYTYDEATGQYTPDANTNVNYEAQPYGEQEQPEQQQEVLQQQEMNYDYSNYMTTEQNATNNGDNANATSITPAPPPNTTNYAAASSDPLMEDLPAHMAMSTPHTAAAAAALSTAAASNDDINNTTTMAASVVDNSDDVQQQQQQPTKVVKPPTSILAHPASASANDAAQQKKKKRVNFVDSSETDESSSVKSPAPITTAGGRGGTDGLTSGVAGSSESDFDFSAVEAESAK